MKHRSLSFMAAAVAVLAVLPYLGVLRAPFVFDDVKLVRDNPSIRDLRGLPATFNIFSRRWDDQELRANYRPLRFLSYAIDYRITRWIHGDFPPASLSPVVFHLHNVLLHALNSLLVLLIGRALLGKGGAALVLALLFALHPLATEAVTYVSGRRDVLSTFFFLSALWVYLEGRGWLSALWVLVLFVLGLLSKEMVVTLPAVILLIDLSRRERFDARRTAVALGLWSLAVGFTLLEALNPRLVAGKLGGSAGSTLLTAPRYVGRYLGLLLFPYPQSIDYSFDAIPVSRGLLSPWTTLPLLLLTLGLAGTGLWALRRRPGPLAVGLLWFLGVLLPVLQIVPIPERFAERFVYLPAVGVFLLAASAFRAIERRRPVPAWTGAAALLFALGLASVLRNQDWRSPLELWGSAARAQPRAARAHLGFGEALQEEGRHGDAARAFSRSLEIFGEAPVPALERGEPGRARGDDLLRWGQVLQARALRAQSYAELGAQDPPSYRKAAADYRWLLSQRDIDGTAIAGSPRHIVLSYQLAACLERLSQAEPSREKASDLRASAAGEFRQVAAMEKAQPALARNAHYYLSKLVLIEGKSEEALREMEEAYRIARESGDLMDRYRLAAELADLLIARKAFDRADELLLASLGELGGRSERKELLYRRARIADRRGDVAGAARALEDALSADPAYGPALLTLASLEEGRGNLDRAEELYRRLLWVAPGETRARGGLKGIELRRQLAREGKSGQAGPDAGASRRPFLEGLLARADAHLQRGEYLAAVAPLSRAALPPADAAAASQERGLRAQALRRLGQVARKLRKYADAEGYLAAAIACDPESHEALRDLADLQLRDLKDQEAAGRTYQEYLDSLPPGQPAEPWVYFNLGSLHEERAPFRAIDLFLEALKAPGCPPSLKRILGYRFAHLGRWEDALQAFQESLAAEPGGDREYEEAEAQEREKARRFVREKVLPRVEGGEALSGETGEPPPGARER